MARGKKFIFVPGPTNVPERILRAMAVEQEDPRRPDAPAFNLPLLAGLKNIFRTKTGTSFIFPSSGTGGWEAALVNCLDTGDHVLACRFGQFSLLWCKMAEDHQLQTTILDEEWGAPANPDRIYAALNEDRSHSIKAVFVVHNETTTGVTSDIAAVRRAMDAAQHPALLFVDGVSSIGSIDFRMDEWGVDLAITGSQKGFMLPAGLSFVGVSEKAMAIVRGRAEGQKNSRHAPHSYFDFNAMLARNVEGYFPYTFPTPLLYGLREALAMIEEEGLDNVIARHQFLASGVRAAVAAWGLKLCAQSHACESNTISAVMVPDGIDGTKIAHRAYNRYNCSLGLGLNRLAGKLFRIGHLGELNEMMVMVALSASEMAMLDCGVKITPGSGLAAAINHFRTKA
ncbi:MAG: aminotransferase class V-fold PLP-dependent enzyme [Candidatus Symbiobacter sp.]|nr:aminotransferase class V-fold PLP-dependent enzyme [Candidatus Symbiobacter sp.]